MFGLLFLGGCATTEYNPLPNVPQPTPTKVAQPSVPTPSVSPIVKAPVKKEGVYHKVQKGQTLYRIAKTYNVPVEEIIATNNIPNAAAIEVGQLIQIPSATEAKDVSTTYTPDQNKDEFAWPLKGKVVSYYNDRKGEAVNKGIDIEGQEGDPVKAAREGNVVLADYLTGYGQTVMIDHGDGFVSVYAQNSKLLVKLGDHVYKGDPVAELGRGGRRAFLHFEVRKGAQSTNPMYYLS